MKLASVRAGNVIGGGDWAKDRILTDVVRHLQAGQPVPVRSPRAVRPWQHVLEPLGGYLTLAARMLQSDDPAWCDAWNFGPMPGEEIPVGRLVELFVQAWGSGAWQDVSDPQQPHEAGVLRLCIDKALHQLGWRPRWSVAEAVRRTAEWFRRFYASPSPDALAACRQDIEAYEVTRLTVTPYSSRDDETLTIVHLPRSIRPCSHPAYFPKISTTCSPTRETTGRNCAASGYS